MCLFVVEKLYRLVLIFFFFCRCLREGKDRKEEIVVVELEVDFECD